MTRKDFEVVAQVVAICGGLSLIQKDKIDKALISSNPSYNAQRFWNAVEENKLKP